MAGNGTVVFGQVKNKEMCETLAGPVAAGVKIPIGMAFENGAEGWKPAVAGISAARCYWTDRELDNSNGALGDIVGDFFGEGAEVVAKSGGIISVDGHVKLGAANDTFLITDIADAIAGAATSIAGPLKLIIGQYRGHVGEPEDTFNVRTAAAADDADIVICIRRAI